jgi:osmotically-inducible protein OsmY
VRLGGIALSDDERRWAVEVVGGVPGVREVVDEMIVAGG